MSNEIKANAVIDIEVREGVNGWDWVAKTVTGNYLSESEGFYDMKQEAIDDAGRFFDGVEIL